jgi:hypothetical protein
MRWESTFVSGILFSLLIAFAKFPRERITQWYFNWTVFYYCRCYNIGYFLISIIALIVQRDSMVSPTAAIGFRIGEGGLPILSAASGEMSFTSAPESRIAVKGIPFVLHCLRSSFTPVSSLSSKYGVGFHCCLGPSCVLGEVLFLFRHEPCRFTASRSPAE